MVTPFDVEILAPKNFARAAAALVTARLPRTGTIVLTGGTTAEQIYPHIAEARPDWSRLTVFFSDERCVPPDDPRSNFKMAATTLSGPFRTAEVHRIRGELEPDAAATDYERLVHPAVDAGVRVALLGLGSDGHIAGMFPDSAAASERDRLCVAVDRPDGLAGVTLTVPALLAAHEVLVVVAGTEKAEAVRRALSDEESAESCPARALADHGAVTLVADGPAASQIGDLYGRETAPKHR